MDFIGKEKNELLHSNFTEVIIVLKKKPKAR
jgi:hypothetical protein